MAERSQDEATRVAEEEKRRGGLQKDEGDGQDDEELEHMDPKGHGDELEGAVRRVVEKGEKTDEEK